ncbi:hypothetical protein HOD88_03215 [archaeon]|jgi:hypothetical protein|nr:hypothetical protein [archaeon]
MAENQSPLERGVMEDLHSSPKFNYELISESEGTAFLGRQIYSELKDSVGRLKKSSIDWGIKNSNSKNWLLREAGLTIASGYVGALFPGEQKKVTDKLGLPEATFSKYNSSRFYGGVILIEHLPFFAVSQSTDTHLDDPLFWLNFGSGVIINGTRYAMSKKGKATPAISGFSLLINGVHYVGKNLSKLVNGNNKN